ncbi:MAG: hypothetical protein JWR34_4331 [Mycobacterium sp.]|nr:hypothetical protein [Mycobacterium sp.]
MSPPNDGSPGTKSEATTKLASQQADTDHQVTARADLGTYLDVTLGATEGYLFVVAAGDPYLDNGKYKHHKREERAYRWPADAESAVGDMLEVTAWGDVYVCAYPMAGAVRTKWAAVARTLVHADVDDDLDLEKVRNLGGFAVYSGTGQHAHAYVPLTESVTGPHHDALCRGLGRHLGAVDPKCSDNDLLRPPGTRNFKPTVTGGEPTAVRWAVRP